MKKENRETGIKRKGWILRLITTLLITVLLFGIQAAAVTLLPTEGGEAPTMEIPGESDSDTGGAAEELGIDATVNEVMDGVGLDAGAPSYGKARLIDEADLLSEAEEASLLTKLNEISERQQFDIVVLTVDSIGGKSPEAFADDYYDYNGYGFGEEKDGCLLLLSMEERDWAVSTTGYGITAITDYGQEALMDEVLPYLSRGRYADGFSLFADGVDHLVTEAKNGNPVDIYDEPETGKERGTVPIGWLFGDLGIGAILSSGPMNTERKKLRSVRNRFNADIYANWQGGVPALGAASGIYQDRYINTTTTSRVIPVVTHTNNNNHHRPGPSGGHGSTIHMGSSGTFHGGSHGKF
ncbi:MAG: TPM domain-containing protein [Lachnospiraceae bacterium]|nr:TPM domain-containing protein [Lachnospiraceae bacterium]